MPIKNINCVCCKGKEAELLYTGIRSVYTDKPYSIVCCVQCGNGITYPEVSREELSKIYSETYLYPVHLLALGEKKYRSRSLAAFIRKQATSADHPDLLEVGCMFGYLLDELKNEYSVSGIDIGEKAVDYCRKRGLDVQLNSVENYIKKNTKKFDIIILSHVLEHLLHPDEVLISLRRILKPGGKIFILVPNYRSVTAGIFRKYWGWWQVPVHVNHFCSGSISFLAERSGYKVRRIKKNGGDSLMLLLNFINLFSYKNKNQEPGSLQKLLIRLITVLFRYWYHAGNEELLVQLELDD
jgi:SAM-dependent methyltransferase